MKAQNVFSSQTSRTGYRIILRMSQNAMNMRQEMEYHARKRYEFYGGPYYSVNFACCRVSLDERSYAVCCRLSRILAVAIGFGTF